MKYPIKVLMDKDKKPFIPFVPTSAITENGTGRTLEEILANLAVPIVNLTSTANDAVSAMMVKMEQYKDIGFSIIYTDADSTGVLFTYSSQTAADTLNKTWTFVSGFDADGNAYNLHITGYYNTETKAFTCSNVELVAGISNEVGNLEALNTTDKSSVVNAINEVDNKTNIIADVYNPTPIPMTYTITDKGTRWPFVLQEDGYYKSTSEANSYSVCEVKFNNATDGKVIIDYIADHELGFDFAIFSNIDKTLYTSNSSDGNTGTTKVKLNTKYSPSPDVKQIVYDMPAGEHFIYIKYAKNHVTNVGADSLKFKIHDEYLEYATKEVTYNIKDYIDEKTGDLNTLTTEAKDNLVDAINEIQPFTKNVIQVRTEEKVILADLDPGLYYCPNMKYLKFYGGISSDMQGRMLLVSKDSSTGGKVGVMFAGNSIYIYHSSSYYDRSDLFLSNVAVKTEVLTKTNTTEYVPTKNFHPTTKQYVDTTVSNAISSLPSIQDFVDNGFDYDTGESESVEVTTTVANVSTVYGFALNANGYYESTNKGKENSWALCKVTINAPQAFTLTIPYISSGESGYDYGIFGQLDTELANSVTDDGATGSAKVKLNCKVQSSTAVKQVSYDIPAGEHFIEIKYRKDGSGNQGNDSLQFKIDSPYIINIPVYVNKKLATTDMLDTLPMMPVYYISAYNVMGTDVDITDAETLAQVNKIINSNYDKDILLCIKDKTYKGYYMFLVMFWNKPKTSYTNTYKTFSTISLIQTEDSHRALTVLPMKFTYNTVAGEGITVTHIKYDTLNGNKKNEYILLEKFYTRIPGYNSSKTQVLKNINGTLKWVTEEVA